MLQKGRTKVEWARWRHVLYGFNTGPYNSDLTPLAQCASLATENKSSFFEPVFLTTAWPTLNSGMNIIEVSMYESPVKSSMTFP